MIKFNKYAGVQVKVTKLIDNKFGGEHPSGINEGYIKVGFVNVEESNNIQSLLVIAGGRFFHTSHVQNLEEHEGFDLLTTLNSVYKVEPLFAAIPGTQEEYSIVESEKTAPCVSHDKASWEEEAKLNERIDIIGQNGNEGTHYDK